MKRFLLLAGIVALLFACASFPEPESQGNSLVIGSLVLDSPTDSSKTHRASSPPG
jgi:hypothetical protein